MCRNIIAEEMFNSSQDQMIGGPVEVDESMFGEYRYYNTHFKLLCKTVQNTIIHYLL